MAVRNKYEKMVYDAIGKHFDLKIDFDREPLINLIKSKEYYDNFYGYSVPRVSPMGIRNWDDIALFDKKKGLDMRIEVKQSNHDLFGTAGLVHARSIGLNKIEKEAALIGFGWGFSNKNTRFVEHRDSFKEEFKMLNVSIYFELDLFIQDFERKIGVR